MTSKRVTLAQVAETAGVSTSTASLVLTGRGTELRISAAVQDRVRSTAERLGYRPNAVSRGLRTGSSRTLGFISDSVATSRVAGHMILGAIEAAKEHGFMLFISETEASSQAELDLIQAMSDRQIDGLILATMFTRRHAVPKATANAPVVLLNSVAPGPVRVDAVLPDEVEAGRAAAQVLLDQGHRKIHLIGAGPRPADVPRDSIAGRERLEGIHAALGAAGVAPSSYFPLPDWTPDLGRAATQQLLQQDPQPGAIICFNDRVAFGAYQVLVEAGLAIPEDVSVISFDDSDIAAWMRPGLTTFALPHHAMGRKAVELLLEQINRGTEPTPPPAVHRIPMPLRMRDSVAPPRPTSHHEA